MMQSTSARAYDLSRYEESRKPKYQRQSPPKLTVRTTKKVKKNVSVLRLFCCCVLLLAVVCVAIQNNIATVELGDQLAKANAQLEEARSKGAILVTQLESTASTKTVEEYAAANLGMGKMERYQITYLNMAGEDRVEIPEPTGSYALLQTVAGTYNDLLEYMKLK